MKWTLFGTKVNQHLGKLIIITNALIAGKGTQFPKIFSQDLKSYWDQKLILFDASGLNDFR